MQGRPSVERRSSRLPENMMSSRWPKDYAKKLARQPGAHAAALKEAAASGDRRPGQDRRLEQPLVRATSNSSAAARSPIRALSSRKDSFYARSQGSESNAVLSYSYHFA